MGDCATLQTFSITLRSAGVTATGSTTPPVILSYGDFMQSIVSFIISAGAIFLLIKVMVLARNRLFRSERAGDIPPAPPSPEVAVLQEIRDTLKDIRATK